MYVVYFPIESLADIFDRFVPYTVRSRQHKDLEGHSALLKQPSIFLIHYLSSLLWLSMYHHGLDAILITSQNGFQKVFRWNK